MNRCIMGQPNTMIWQYFGLKRINSLARLLGCVHSHNITATFTKFMRERKALTLPSAHFSNTESHAVLFIHSFIRSFIHWFIHLFYRRMLTFAYDDFVHFHFDFDLICFKIWVTVDFYVFFVPFPLFFCGAFFLFYFLFVQLSSQASHK